MRRRQPLQIKKSLRYIQPTVIILGDGETEEAYVDRLKQLNYFSNVKLKFEIGDEFSFETKIKEHAYNKEVHVIIDIDNIQPNTEKYRKIQQLYQTNKYKGQIFFNNYSFELWLLNHIRKCGKPVIKKKEYNSNMKNCFKVESWADNKNEINRGKIMGKINCKSIDKAAKNIKELNRKTPFANPSSNMDEWVKIVNKIK